MSLTVTIQAMLQAGCSAEQLAEVVAAHEREQERIRSEKRAKRAAQKRAEREKRRQVSPDVAATTSDNVRHDATTCDNSSPSPSSPSDGFPPANRYNINTPLSLTTPTSTPSPRFGRGSRLPPDWAPTFEDVFFAEQEGIEWKRELDRFRDYWIAQAGQKGVKANWSATWRNWCRRAEKRQMSRQEKLMDWVNSGESNVLTIGEESGSDHYVSLPHPERGR